MLLIYREKKEKSRLKTNWTRLRSELRWLMLKSHAGLPAGPVVDGLRADQGK